MASEFRIIMQLDRLIQRAELLTHMLAETQQRVRQLESENETLRNTLRDYHKQAKEDKEKSTVNPREVSKKPAESPQSFQSPKELAKIVSDNPANMVSHADLKQKLDEYIQEIDRCITHLSNLS